MLTNNLPNGKFLRAASRRARLSLSLKLAHDCELQILKRAKQLARLFRFSVPRRGFEPLTLAGQRPKRCAYTNSATWAIIKSLKLKH